MTIDIARLRALAMAAPDGPWHTSRTSREGYPCVSNESGLLLSTFNARKLLESERDMLAYYVAAIDPQTLLALLDLLEAQQ